MVLSQDLFLLDTIHGDENKNRKGIMLQQYYANCLVNETRKNCHSFLNQVAENYWLIYNWNANPDYALSFFQTVNTSQSAWPELHNISSN